MRSRKLSRGTRFLFGQLRRRANHRIATISQPVAPVIPNRTALAPGQQDHSHGLPSSAGHVPELMPPRDVAETLQGSGTRITDEVLANFKKRRTHIGAATAKADFANRVGKARRTVRIVEESVRKEPINRSETIVGLLGSRSWRSCKRLPWLWLDCTACDFLICLSENMSSSSGSLKGCSTCARTQGRAILTTVQVPSFNGGVSTGRKLCKVPHLLHLEGMFRSTPPQTLRNDSLSIQLLAA